MSSQTTNPPKVFISYSWDSLEHMNRVLALSDRLRREGIDCNIDQYEESPPEGWPRWMENQLDWAEFVLVICTEQYYRRFRGQEEAGRGRGVTWEGAIITQNLYDAQGKNTKFIPIVFSSPDSDHIPSILRSFTRYSLDTEEEYRKLYRYLTNQPSVLRPPVGPLVQLPRRERQEDFSEGTSRSEPELEEKGQDKFGLDSKKMNGSTAISSTQQQKNRRDLVVPILVAVIGAISTIAVVWINKLQSPLITPPTPPVASSPNEPSPTTSENQPPPVVQPTEPGSVDAPIVETPPTFSQPAPEQPASPLAAQSYFKPCTGNTNNVIVASGFYNEEQAYAKIKSLRYEFPQFRFKLFYTVAEDGISNKQYAIIVGHGLNQTEAQALVEQVKSAGVATDAYSEFQSWASPCKDWSGVER